LGFLLQILINLIDLPLKHSLLKHFTVFIFLIFSSQIIYTQEYIDIFKVNYATILDAGFVGSDATTNVNIFDTSVTYPIKINNKAAIITGIDYNQHELDLFPGATAVSLKNITLKAGLNLKHGKKWSGSYVFLPKIASQDLHTDGDHFFFGGVLLLKYQKNDRLQYRFGAYSSSEGFGTFATPLIGMYYISENKKWEFTATLPINADLNHCFNDSFCAGLGFQAVVRSFSLSKEENTIPLYAQVSNIEFGTYLQYGFLDKSILVRLQGGYSTVSYEVFEEGDTLPIRVSAFEFGDDRNLLNPEMKGNFFIRIGGTYRFDLSNQ